MMVSEGIYIRKALEKIDARNVIEERERLTAENDAERRQAKTPIERIQENYLSPNIEIGLAHLVLRVQGSAQPSQRWAAPQHVYHDRLAVQWGRGGIQDARSCASWNAPISVCSPRPFDGEDC
jgi:hypothetical protein